MTESIAKLLGDTAELMPLARKLEGIRRLQRRYRTLAPAPLAEASRICAIDGTTVVVLANSGPVAAALRQMAPRLLEGLRAAGRKSSKHPEDQELNSIRIEVQVKDGKVKRPPVSRSEMPRDALGALAQDLTPSPLKESLERIGAAGRRPAKPKP